MTRWLRFLGSIDYHTVWYGNTLTGHWWLEVSQVVYITEGGVFDFVDPNPITLQQMMWWLAMHVSLPCFASSTTASGDCFAIDLVAMETPYVF